MTDSEIYQQAKEKIAEWLFEEWKSFECTELSFSQLCPAFRESWRRRADRLLALKDEKGNHILEIRSGDQTLPPAFFFVGSCGEGLSDSEAAQKTMVDLGWVRVVQPEKGTQDA